MTLCCLCMGKQDQLTLSPSSPGRPGIPRSPWDTNTLLQTHYQMPQFRLILDVVALVAKEINSVPLCHTWERFIILKGKKETGFTFIPCGPIGPGGPGGPCTDINTKRRFHHRWYYCMGLDDQVSINPGVNDTQLYSDMGKMVWAEFQFHHRWASLWNIFANSKGCSAETHMLKHVS